MFGLALAGAAWGQTQPVIEMEIGCTPVKTSRVFQTGLGPNPRGGWNFICQCMNYKSTVNKEKIVEKLDNGRHYLRYADTTARPEAEWVIADLDGGTFKVVNLPGFHAAEISGGGCLAGNGRVFFAADYGHIYYYEPHAETIRILGRVHDSITVLRHFYKLELGPDGLVYGASQSTSGLASVLRLHPETLAWKLITDVGLPGRRTLTYGYMIAMPALERIVVSGAKKDAALLVYDLDLNQHDEIEIEPGLRNTGHMLPVADTQFLGWYKRPAATNMTLYLYDLSARMKLRTVEIDSPRAWLLERPVDETCWLLAGADLFQVDPASLETRRAGVLYRTVTVPVSPGGGTVLRHSRPLWIGRKLCGSTGGEVLISSAVEAVY